VTLSREAVARSKQLVAINSSSSLSAILRSTVLICNDVYYDEACGYIFGYFWVYFWLFLAEVEDLLATSYGLVSDKSAGKLRGSCRQAVVN